MSDPELSVYEETPLKKHEYTIDKLLSFQLVAAASEKKENVLADLDEKIRRFGLSRQIAQPIDSKKKANENQNVVRVNENVNQADSSENDYENSINRLKEGVLNKTRLLQMKLEQLKNKAANAQPE